MSQKEISFQVISSLRSEGNSDVEILIIGPSILLDLYKEGRWTKSKGGNSDEEILKYGRNLLKNWMMKDPRLTGGVEYVPKTTRGPRSLTPKTPDPTPDLRKMLEYFREKNPENETLIRDLEERIMWDDLKKVG